MDPIDCITDTAVDDVIDNYCLYHSTYTITVGDLGDAKKYLVPHPGISGSTSNKSSENIKFHQYYLWVALLLVIQGASFYIPRGIWKSWSGSSIGDILKEKDEAFSILNDEQLDSDSHETTSDSGTHMVTDEKQEELLRSPLGKHLIQQRETNVDDLSEQTLNRFLLFILSKRHGSYYWKLLACETLNLTNAILQLLVMNMFLGFGLSRDNYWYNEDILQLFQEANPFEKREFVEQIFPKISACTFYSYGPSGNIINYEAICVLPINAINEKIYASLYVWLLFLISVSALGLVYRLLILLPFVRNVLLKLHLRSEELGNFSLNKLRKTKRLHLGNWQLLLQLTGNSNMDSWELTNIVKYLCRKCENMEKTNKSV